MAREGGLIAWQWRGYERTHRDRLNLLLCAGQLSAATRTTILTAVNSIAATTDTGKLNRVYTAVMLVMASLDYLIQK